MKQTTRLTLLALAALTGSAAAATFSTPYSNPGPDGNDFPYEGKLTLSGTDSWLTTATPGAWSYRDLKVGANPNRGWGHTARWYLVELLSPASLLIGMSSTNSLAQPGFALYSGESVNDVAADLHTFSNNGNDLATLNTPWDKNGPGNTPGLAFTGFGYNGVTQELNGSFTLPAGLYTIAIGNAADSNNAPAAIAYNLSFSTVPEPATSLMAALAAALPLLRRRR